MLIDMKSDLTWKGPESKAPGKYPLEEIQNKITSFQEEDLNVQYNKLHVYDVENINSTSLGHKTHQPFIIRGIQKRHGVSERYGSGTVDTFAHRLAEDSERFAKLLISPKGLIWNLKQFGLHASNPNVESVLAGGKGHFARPTKVFDPIGLFANIPGAPIGIHSARHGKDDTRGKYGDVQAQFIRDDAENVVRNRLAKLKVELIGNESALAESQSSPTALWNTVIQGDSKFSSPQQKLEAGHEGAKIETLSGTGGPHSVYGIGYTTMHRTTMTGTALKDPVGNSYWGIHYNASAPYQADNGSARTLADKTAPGNSISKTFDFSGHPLMSYSIIDDVLPNLDAQTGGYGLLRVQNKFNADGYIANNSPGGGRTFTFSDEAELARPKINPSSAKIDARGESIIEKGLEQVTGAGAPYLESHSPAQNKTKRDGLSDSPGGGRYTGTSTDASEETHTRTLDVSGEDILEAAHKYHVYQNRGDDYPEGYYSLMNSSGGPRGKPSGASVHNIFRTIEAEQAQVRTQVNGKKIHEHVHSFLYGASATSVSTAVINTIKLGYNANWLNSTQVDGSDWDTADRTNLHMRLDPASIDVSAANTPQIRKSAERVFEPGFSVDPKGQHVITSPSDMGLISNALGSTKSGDNIFNYFTPDLKYFSSVTRIQLDDGDAGHDYNSIGMRAHDRQPLDILTYNGKDYSPKYTAGNPKVGPSPDVGQQAIPDQTSQPLTKVDVSIKIKLDPLKNGKLPNSVGPRIIGGLPDAKAGTPVVYSYMDYTKLRSQESAINNPKRVNEFRQNVLGEVAAEIKSRSRGILGYGGAKTADMINVTMPGESPGTEDMVPFYISELGGAQTLYFRAGINSIGDSFSPSWSQLAEIGRADPKVVLEGWARSFSLDLTLAAGSEGELNPMWEKLNVLGSWTAPDYSKGNGYTGTFIELTLGDLYQQVPCYLTGFSVDIDSETPWEITAGKRRPKYASISLDLTYLGKERPQKTSNFFGL